MKRDFTIVQYQHQAIGSSSSSIPGIARGFPVSFIPVSPDFVKVNRLSTGEVIPAKTDNIENHAGCEDFGYLDEFLIEVLIGQFRYVNPVFYFGL
jgi:hypothetical protein